MDSYRVGDVVNGHVWTGTAWEPAPAPPAPAVPSDPSQQPPTWAGAFKAATVILWVVVAALIAEPTIDKLGANLQRTAHGETETSIANFTRGLGLILNTPAVLWVMLPLAIGATIGLILVTRRAADAQEPDA